MKNRVVMISVCALLCVLSIISLFSVTAGSFAEYDQWVLEIPSMTNKTEYYLEEYLGSETNLVIPDTVLERNIVKINSNAFKNNNELLYCTIPNTIREIGDYAFYGCSELRELKLPASVSVLGDGTFYKCTSLATVEIAEGTKLKVIPYATFSGCTTLMYASISNGVEELDDYCFSGCAYLYTVIIPPSVTVISDTAFDRCTNTTLYVYSGSYALEYAKANNIPYVNLGEYVEPTEPATATDSSVEPTSSTGAEVTSSMATEATEATSSTVTDATEATSSTATDATESIATEPTASSNASSTATEPTEEVTSSSSTQATDASESVSATANTNESASTTATATQASSSAETTDSYKTYFIGDADLDGRITIKDATKIQKHIAKLLALDEIPLALADANNDTKVSVKDATQIQKFIAGFKDILFVGDEVKL